MQPFAANGPGKGFGAWPTALPAAEEGLRPDPLTSPSKPIRKNWETALNVATPGPASAAKAAVQASAAKGPGKGFGAWPTALPPAEEGLRPEPPNVTFEIHKKELGDSSQRGHARPGFGSQGSGPASAAKGPGKGFGAWPTALPAAEEGLRPDPLTSPSKPIRKNWETALNVATPGPASAAKAAVQASAAKGPGKGFGAWPTALPAAEEGLRPDPLTSPSKHIRKNWETALNVATPGPASGCGAGLHPGKGFGAWPTALPAAEEGLRPDPLTSPSKPIRKNWETALNVATPVPGPASAAKAAAQASAAKGPGKGFGAWPTALPAAEEGLRPEPPNVTFETHKKELGDSFQRGHARPGFGSQGCGAGICSQRSRKGLWSLANGPAGCRGGFETGPPNVTFETHKKELGDSSQRGHARPGFGSQGCSGMSNVAFGTRKTSL